MLTQNPLHIPIPKIPLMFLPKHPWLILLKPESPCTLRIQQHIPATRHQPHMLQLLRRERIPRQPILLRIRLYQFIRLSGFFVAEVGDKAVYLDAREEETLRTAAMGIHLYDAVEWHQGVLPDHER